MHRSAKVQCLAAAGFCIALYALNVRCTSRRRRRSQLQPALVDSRALCKQVEKHLDADDNYEAMCDLSATVPRPHFTREGRTARADAVGIHT